MEARQHDPVVELAYHVPDRAYRWCRNDVRSVKIQKYVSNCQHAFLMVLPRAVQHLQKRSMVWSLSHQLLDVIRNMLRALVVE